MTMFTSGQELAGRFLLIRPLGSGTTPVWLAHEHAARENAVLKIFAGRRDAAEREYGRLIALSHPNILRPVALLHADDLTLLVMPPVGVGTLGNLRAQPFGRFLTPVMQAARAAAWLHAQSLVHGDLKPDNVLLDAVGDAQLIDFGNCLPAGESRPADAPVSAFSASPQQRAAQPASFADDIHAFGAMLYEMLCGQPPGYLAGDSVPAVHPAPVALLSLTSHCLANDPQQRPPSMTAVLDELEAIAVSAAAIEPRAATSAPLLTPPDAPLDAVAPTWRRAATSESPSTRQLQRQGFRRGFALAAVAALALVAIALFVLPEIREQPAAAPAATPAAATTSTVADDATDRDLRELALVKSEAEELRADLAARLEALNKAAAEVWSADKAAAATASLRLGEQQLQARDYAAARTSFKALQGLVAELERERTAALGRVLQQGQVALQSRDAMGASAAFDLALRIDPSNDVARRGARRAGALDAVWAALTRAATLEQQGSTGGAAAAYREAARLDAESAEAAAGVARTGARLANDEYGRTLAQVFAAIDARRADQARSALARARAMRAADPALAGAEQQLVALEAAGKLTTALAEARAAESSERWSEAVSRFRDALGIDPTLADAREALERATERAALDQQLATLLGQPERAYSGPVYAAATEALRRAQAINPAGPRLADQRARAAELLRLADTPVQVPLLSDNLTAVTIYRVGELGTFSERRIDLRPGRYTVVGTRAGFRDVRRELNVLPTAPPTPVRVACEEPI